MERKIIEVPSINEHHLYCIKDPRGVILATSDSSEWILNMAIKYNKIGKLVSIDTYENAKKR